MATAFGRGGSTARHAGRPAAQDIHPLEQIVTLDLLPRLVVAHAPLPTVETLQPSVGPEQVERFARMSLELEAHLLLDVAESFLLRGLSVETLFIKLLAPAARQLGKGWEDDRLDFVDVTMGLWRLQEVLRDIASRATRAAPSLHGSALFLPFPGDQHNFGTAMIQECFSVAGWDAEMLPDATLPQLLDLLATRSFDLLGLTLSVDAHIQRLPALVRAVRSVSMNPQLRIMIGGRACAAHGGITALCGADGSAASAPDAVVVAERLVRSARAAAA